MNRQRQIEISVWCVGCDNIAILARVMSADLFHRNEYFHNPYVSNATKFYDLNDDCILEIFQRISILDLCAIRYTCKRFDALSEFFFKMVYKTLNFSNWNVKGEYALLTEDEMKTILTTFGGQMDSITVNADSFEPESKIVLQIINEYCGAKRLRFFKMVKFVIDEQMVENCDRLWSNIDQLTIDKCYVDDDVLKELLRKCSTLTQLEMIRQMNTDGRCLMHEFPQLEGFSLRSNDNFDPLCMNTFLQKNTQLRSLSLIGCNFVDDEIFEIIADNLVNLEALYIRVVHVTSQFETNLENLLRLQHLRKLEFNCGLRPIVPFIHGLAMTNRIEQLGISSAELTPELSAALCNLKNVQILKFISMYDGQLNTFKPIAQQLEKLKELHILECDVIDFEQLFEFVENAGKLEKLLIIQCSKIIPMNAEQFVRMADCVQKRVDKLQLSIHLDYYELKLTKELLSEEMRREYQHILQVVSLSWEDNYKSGVVSDNLYFADEGGAYDYDPVDDDMDESSDEEEEFNDPYNVSGLSFHCAFDASTFPFFYSTFFTRMNKCFFSPIAFVSFFFC